MIRRSYSVAVVAVAVFGLLLVGSNNAESADAEALYKKHCKKCHAMDGKGKEKMLKPLKLTEKGIEILSIVTQAAKDKKDEEISKLIRDGKEKMKPYKEKLSEEEITALTQYVRKIQGGAK